MASVLAPAVAPELGLPPERVGLFVGVAYLSAMLSGLLAGPSMLARGPITISIVALLATSLGLAATTPGIAVLMLGGAVLIGSGYGLTNPAAAIVLQQQAPPQRSALFFSIKQTGVPLGVALSGTLAPALYFWLGWQAAVLVLALPGVLLAGFLHPVRPVFDREAGGGRKRSGRARLAAPLLLVLRSPRLRRLGALSFVYATTQMSFLTFLVTYLKLERGMSLTAAASVLAVAQLTSFVARIGWGHVADRWIRPAVLLGCLGIAMALSCVALAVLPQSASYALALAVATACAATAVGWNGVYLSELVRDVPRERVGAVTGATQFLTFFGATSGPVLFGQAISLSASYSVAYLGLAVLPAATGVLMLLAARRERPARS
ncbi:MAG: MFS transporter [Burkholderiales bacterium]|nr:MAG: MFS transporter [Burkholderiales bacterium]